MAKYIFALILNDFFIYFWHQLHRIGSMSVKETGEQ